VVVSAAIMVVVTARVAGGIAIGGIGRVNDPGVCKIGGVAQKENAQTVDSGIWTIRNGNNLLGSLSSD
jgi:hypothetical protein